MRAFLAEAWWVVVALVLSLLPLAVQFARQGVMSTLRVLDRRWIFLLMFWAVLMPIYYVGVRSEEHTSELQSH